MAAGDDVARLLHEGDLTVEGRLTEASNATLYCRVQLDGTSLACVYKPVAGERPLHDFPDGTLASRELAAYAVSEAAGWRIVPRTIERDGPFGRGMCQQWIEESDLSQAVTVLRDFGEDEAELWCPVLAVQLSDGSEGVLAHRDGPALRRIALFDAVVNNADRKGGHLLPLADGTVLGIDHGLTFHAEDKLRTLLWGFAERALEPGERAELEKLRDDERLAARLSELLSPAEIAAFHGRITALLQAGVFPGPDGRMRPMPWPPI
ncbi:MAG TPA: SCO1664 family protein [Actinospica sp.]|jgi:uncharacterized repeat protein (TIGR03843 family)|nr:SCO1664 family protein [Actinospica sp.]